MKATGSLIRRVEWRNVGALAAVAFTCWSCGRELASDKGWLGVDEQTGRQGTALALCHFCTAPTFLELDFVGQEVVRQHPAPPAGREVDHLPELVAEIYRECRVAAGAGAPTASALALRTLISYVACDCEAPEGKKFAFYVDWLAKEGYLPPGGKHWVGKIKDVGNEAAHELRPIAPAQVTLLLDFAEELLRFVYELPQRLKDDEDALDAAEEDDEPEAG